MNRMLVNKVYNVDCIKFMESMPPESIDLVITSPPYGDLRNYDGHVDDYNFEKTALWLNEIIKPGGIIVWVEGDITRDYSEQLLPQRHAIYFKEFGLKVLDTMIWVKDYGVPQNDGIRYQSRFEFMLVFSKGRPKTFNPVMRKNKYAGEFKKKATGKAGSYNDGSIAGKVKDRVVQDEGLFGNVLSFNVGYGKTTNYTPAYGHPAMFPESLAEFHVRSWSNPGDIVFDPFMGSGTVAVAAAACNRVFIGCEINKKYYEEIIIPRIKSLPFVIEEKELV